MPVMYRNVVWKCVQMQSKFTAWNVIACLKNMCEINSINMSGNIGLFLCNPTYVMEHLLHFHPVRGF